MRAFGYAIIAAMVVITGLCASWIDAAEQAAPDEPFYQLDARYHELPQALVDKLMKEVPRPWFAQGRSHYCLDDKDFPDFTYCVCYSTDACRDLRAQGICKAKIGIVRPGVGVCKSNVVTVTGG